MGEDTEKPKTAEETNKIDEYHAKSRESIDTYYDGLLGAKFADEYRVVDVTVDYPWTLNPPKKSYNIAAIPFVYAVEYKQRYGVTATNLINDIYAIKRSGQEINSYLGNVADDAVKAAQKGAETANKFLLKTYNAVKNTMGSIFDSFGETGESVKEYLTNVEDKITGIYKNLDTNFSEIQTSFGGSSGLLDPYAYLYSLKGTGKSFCFPFLTENAAMLNIANDFGSDGSTSLITKTFSETVSKIAQGLTQFAADVQELSNLASKESSKFVMYNIEKAKAFSFPTTGRNLVVRFPLFNTTKKDAWENNYKFIILFALRNMLFRRDNVTYYPPLIYDVCSPGWGRMPLSYVKQFSAKPVGMIRTLEFDCNKLGLGDASTNGLNTTVNVPEAWIVEIQFQSLIADSANLYLSSIIDLPIVASVSGEDWLKNDRRTDDITNYF